MIKWGSSLCRAPLSTVPTNWILSSNTSGSTLFTIRESLTPQTILKLMAFGHFNQECKMAVSNLALLLKLLAINSEQNWNDWSSIILDLLFSLILYGKHSSMRHAIRFKIDWFRVVCQSHPVVLLCILSSTVIILSKKLRKNIIKATMLLCAVQFNATTWMFAAVS